MTVKCSKCQQGHLNGEATCTHCSSAFEVSKLVEFKQLDYLLEEVKTPKWQLIFQVDGLLKVKQQYNTQWKKAGLELGLLPVTDTERLTSKYQTTLYLLRVLPTFSISRDFEAARYPLIKWVELENNMQRVEYQFLSLTPPELPPTLTAETEIGLIQKAFYFLDHLVNEGNLSAIFATQLTFILTSRLDWLKAAQEAARKAKERAEITPVPASETPVPAPLAPAPVLKLPQVADPAPVQKPKRPPFEFSWDKIWSGLLSETTLRALLYIGALLVVASAIIFSTLNWNQFPALIQASMIVGANLTAYGVGVAILLWLRLRLAGLTFIAIGSAILPLAIYGFSRPELLNLDNSGTWTIVSVVILPFYFLTLFFVKERLFSYVTTLATFNAFWAVLNQIGLAPEWLAVASVGFSALLVWLDGKLEAKPGTMVFASAPFWVGQALVLLSGVGVFGYYVGLLQAGENSASVQWGMGITWWLILGFYGLCAWRDRENRTVYVYGTTISATIATFLTLQKFEVLAPSYGVILGTLAFSYLAIQNLPELVEHLNDNQNIAPWNVKEVLNVNKPLNLVGWVLLLGSIFLSSTRLTLSMNLALVVSVMVIGALLYNWRWLGYLAVLTGAASFGLIASNYVLTEQGSWAFVIAALICFGLWLAVRRTSLIRVSYFSRPLEYMGHVATVGVLLFSGVRADLLYPHNWETAITYSWPVVAVIYGLLALVYRRRWWVDIAIALLVAVCLITTFDWSLILTVSGLVMALAGLCLLEAHIPLFGKPLGQWGYALMVAGLALSFNRSHSELFLITGLFIMLSLGSALLAHLGRAPYLKNYRITPGKHLDQILSGLWLYPALGLLPYWLWLAFPLSEFYFGLLLVGLAVCYFGLTLLLTTQSNKEKYNFELKEFTAPWTLGLGWLVTGVFGLFIISNQALGYSPGLHNYQPWCSWGCAALLALTLGYAAYRFKHPSFNWLIAGLLVWMLYFGLVMVSRWNMVTSLSILAGVEIVLAVVGYRLSTRYGEPFRWTMHLLLVVNGMASLVMYLYWLKYWTKSLPDESLYFLLPLVIGAGLTLLLGIFRNHRLLYLSGYWFSLLVMYIGLWGRSKEVSSLPLITACGFVVLAAIAAFARPYLPGAAKKIENSLDLFIDNLQHPLLQLSHIWAGFALLLAANNETIMYKQTFMPGMLVALTVLYLFRSWYEKSAELLVLVMGLFTAGLYYWFRQFEFNLNYLGLSYLGLAIVYLLVSRLYHHQLATARSFDYKLGYQIFSFGGQILLPASLILSLAHLRVELIALVVTGVVTVWLAKLERAEWGYGTLVMGITAYGLGYYLLALPFAYFGIALFVPALALVLAALWLRRYGGQRFATISTHYQIVAGLLIVVGLPQSLTQDWLMLTHTTLLALVGVVVMVLRKEVVWLYPAIFASGYAVSLAIYKAGISTPDFGLALLALAFIYQVAMLYFNYRANWLKEEERASGRITLLFSAQMVALLGLIFSASADWRLAIQLLALTALSLVNLYTRGTTLWKYTALGFGQLAYLALVSCVLTGGKGLSIAGIAEALLPVTLVLVWLAYQTGVKTNSRFAVLLGDNRSWQLLVQEKSTLFYFAASIDIVVSLCLSITTPFTALLVGGVLTVALTVWALLEENRWIAWFSFVTFAIALGGSFILTGMELSVQAVVVVALAFGFHCLHYLATNRARLTIYTLPTIYVASAMVGVGGLLWFAGLLYNGANQLLWDNLSWLLAIIGLNYQLVSLMEQRRLEYKVSYVRYMGYGAVVLIDIAFSMRLLFGSVTQWQFYILPIGLACLVFSWLERRHENLRVAHLLETTGLMLLLGTSLLQAFGMQTEGIDRNFYGFWLLFESILVLFFGAAQHLKYYFFGGVVAALLSVTALLFDPARVADKWVMLGIAGLVLISIALFLERKREMVIHLSKTWYYQLKQWQ